MDAAACTVTSSVEEDHISKLGHDQTPANHPIPMDTLLHSETNDSMEDGDKLYAEYESKLKEFRRILAQMQPKVPNKGGGGGMEVSEEAAMRWLRARGMQAKAAAKMAAENAAWRPQMLPENRAYVDEGDVEAVLRHNEAFLQGHSKTGNPFLLFLAKHHFPPPSPLHFQRYVMYVLEKALASAPNGIEKILVIVDVKGVGVKNLDLKSMVLGLQVLQNHYPERLGKLYFVNMSTLFCTFWKYASHLVDKVTKEKFNFLASGNMASLLQDVDEDVLPIQYGGKAEMIPIQDARVPLWPPVSVETNDST